MFYQSHKPRPIPSASSDNDFIPMLIMLSLIVFNCFGSAVVLNLIKHMELGFLALLLGALVIGAIYRLSVQERRKSTPRFI